MNRYINRFMILAAVGLGLAGCNENDWNDKLDGFEVPDKNTSATKLEYTMTATDYAQLAGLKSAKALAGEEHADALAAVGSDGCFNAEINPEQFIPLFLGQPTFQHFSANEGSAVKVTYQTTGEYSDVVKGVMNASKYTVSTNDYISVWESDENYTEAFTPSKPASKSIPTILNSAYPDAVAGDYVIVTYNRADVDPTFDTTPEEPKFELTSLLGTAATDQTLTVNGYISAFDTQGFILTDNSGSIYCYRGRGFNDGSYEVGTQVTVEGTISSRNKSIQFGNAATVEIAGKQEVTYGTPKTYTGAELDALVAQDEIPYCTYISMTGEVVISGNNINLNVDGASTAKGSPSYCTDADKATLTAAAGQTVTVEGYWYAVAGGKYCSICVTKVITGTAKAAASRGAVTVASAKEYAVYTFNGSTWSTPDDMTILNPSDYRAMGQKYDNLSGTGPQTYLPTYLQQTYPYASADDKQYVVYNYYNGSSTVVRCAECVYNGSEWTGSFSGATMVTAQFVKKNGKWLYSPDVVIALSNQRSDAFTKAYYQACVDYVKDNVTDGSLYVGSHGDDEFYSGASAYYNNVAIRPNKAIEQYADGYKGMTDDEIATLMKTRFAEEVMLHVVTAMNPDAAPTSSGVQPAYTVTFYWYDGAATHTGSIVYRVTAPGTFAFESADWGD